MGYRRRRILGALAVMIWPLVACTSGAAAPEQSPTATATATPTLGLPPLTATSSPPPEVETTPPADPSAPHVVSGLVPHGEGRIIVTLDGEDYPIDNGGRIDLGSGLAVELYLDPFPPATLSMLMDVYLEADGQPVEDGFVGIRYDMLAMEHGPFTGSGKAIGGGHFIVPLEYIMFGAWDQELTIRAGEQRTYLPVVVVAKP